VTANIFNKQLWTTNKVWSSNFEVGQGANSSLLKNQPVMKCYTGPWTVTGSLE